MRNIEVGRKDFRMKRISKIILYYGTVGIAKYALGWEIIISKIKYQKCLHVYQNKINRNIFILYFLIFIFVAFFVGKETLSLVGQIS